jgi:hypothetical protein
MFIDRMIRLLADSPKMFLCRFPDLVRPYGSHTATMPRCRDVSAVGVKQVEALVSMVHGLLASKEQPSTRFARSLSIIVARIWL